MERFISFDRIRLAADVNVPVPAAGLVLFAHGSGSSRYSPRNRHVAGVLNQAALGTVLVDLLTEQEEAIDDETAEVRFDIPLLGHRVAAITEWIGEQSDLKDLPLGYFGASTGAAAALAAAAERPRMVRAVVSRGGRPDLAGMLLAAVRAPSLFIVGENDAEVLRLNRFAISQLPGATARRLEIIPGASHLFEEPGALDRVAVLAEAWFREHLPLRGRVKSIP